MKEAEVGEADWTAVERVVLLRTIDSLWVEHLTELDDMRRGIGLRGYAQQDPLVEFRREAYNLYAELRGFIRHQLASSILRVQVTRQEAPAPQVLPGPGQPGQDQVADAQAQPELAGSNGSSEAGRQAAVPQTAAAGRAAAAGNAILGSIARGLPPPPATRGIGTARRRGVGIPGRFERIERPPTRLRPGRPADGTQRRVLLRLRTQVQEVPRPVRPPLDLTVGMRQALIRLVTAAVVGRPDRGVYGAFRIWSAGPAGRAPSGRSRRRPGAAQYNGRRHRSSRPRLQHAVDLFQTGQYGYLLVTGGKQPGDRTTEAAAGRQFAIDHGVPADRILREDQGRNTLESLDAVKTTLAAQSISDAVFVSDRSHMLRVLRIAKDLGITAYGSPTTDSPGDSDPVHVVEITFHELGGLAEYFISGKTPPD